MSRNLLAFMACVYCFNLISDLVQGHWWMAWRAFLIVVLSVQAIRKP